MMLKKVNFDTITIIIVDFCKRMCCKRLLKSYCSLKVEMLKLDILLVYYSCY